LFAQYDNNQQHNHIRKVGRTSQARIRKGGPRKIDQVEPKERKKRKEMKVKSPDPESRNNTNRLSSSLFLHPSAGENKGHQGGWLTWMIRMLMRFVARVSCM